MFYLKCVITNLQREAQTRPLTLPFPEKPHAIRAGKARRTSGRSHSVKGTQTAPASHTAYMGWPAATQPSN